MLESRSISPPTLIIVALLLIPMAVRPTSPLVPYHDFNVSGRIERLGGGPLQNFTVAFVHKGMQTGDEYVVIGGGSQPLALTSDTGQFHVHATIYDYFAANSAELLAVAVLVPGDSFIQGESFAYDSVRPTEDRRAFEQESDGCCESPTESMHTIGFIYHYPDQVVTIP